MTEFSSLLTTFNSSQTAFLSICSPAPLVCTQLCNTSFSFCHALSSNTQSNIMLTEGCVQERENKWIPQNLYRSCFLSRWYVIMSSWMPSSSSVRAEAESVAASSKDPPPDAKQIQILSFVMFWVIQAGQASCFKVNLYNNTCRWRKVQVIYLNELTSVQTEEQTDEVKHL